MTPLNIGFVTPYARLVLLAVTVRDAGATIKLTVFVVPL